MLMILHQKNLSEAGLHRLLAEDHQLLLECWKQEDKKIKNDKQQIGQEDKEASVTMR